MHICQHHWGFPLQDCINHSAQMCTRNTNSHQNVSGQWRDTTTCFNTPPAAMQQTKKKGSFPLAVSLLMNLWCTVVKPNEMSPRAVLSSLKWPFRIDQAGYRGYPDASTTCWAARKHVTEDVAHISEATGDLSYKSHTHIRDHISNTSTHTRTDIRDQRLKLHEHMRWTGYIPHTHRDQKLSLSHTQPNSNMYPIHQRMWLDWSENSFTHTYSLIKKLWVKTW